MTIALYHFHATQIKRSAGQSAIASAAYRSGEKLFSEYYGEASDYTRKGGVAHSEILLPPHAPPEYTDRQTLWNAVEKAEPHPQAQLAYSFDIALQNEFSLEENIALARQFLSEQFVSRGMICDFAVHLPDKEDGGIANPHFHVMCPIRPLKEKGGFGKKQEKYKAEHDSEIRQFYAVKRKLDNAGLSGKKLTPKQWQAELDRLMEQYVTETAELKPVYADLKKLRDIQFKVDSVLHDQQRREQQRKQEVEH